MSMMEADRPKDRRPEREVQPERPCSAGGPNAVRAQGPTHTSNTDDLISDGSHLKDGQLQPNSVYTTGEHNYVYRTNEDGLIVHASTDDLHFKTHEGRLPHNPTTPGKLREDHAGHLFSDRFGGSPELDNLVSQSRQVNLSDYKMLENEWAQALESGKAVTVDITVNYASGDIPRPTSFEVFYTIDGVPFFKFITN